MNDISTSRVTGPRASLESRDRPRVCIVAAELEGPFFNGGVGTANRALALALCRLGCEVDILYTLVFDGQPVCLRGTFAEQVAAYARLGIRLMAIPNMAAKNNWPARSYLAMEHLIEGHYQVALFDDLFGIGYYSLLARKTLCPHLGATAMCVTTHGALEWVTELSQNSILNPDSVQLLEMERRSVELADVVKAPSAYLLRKYTDYGWPLPVRSVVMPNFVSQRRAPAKTMRRGRIDELVFFGRLETRKGLWLFIRAIERLKFKLAGRTVTFLGKADLSAARLIVQHSLCWPFEVRLLTNYDRNQALGYMRRAGRLAVMPSPEDNSPSTVLECLDEGIPFIASQGSGGEELVHPDCRPANLFEPTLDGLVAQIEEALTLGGITARHAFGEEDLEVRYRGLLEDLLAISSPGDSAKAETDWTGEPPAYLALIPDDYDLRQAAEELLSLSARLQGRLDVHAVARHDADLRACLAGRADDLLIAVHSYADVASLLGEMAGGPNRVVGVGPLSQHPTLEWFERARRCFEDSDISALTGMSARPADVRLKEVGESYLSVQPDFAIDRYLIGNSSPGLAMSLGSNSGFAFLRSEVCGLIAEISPRDRRYDQTRQPVEYIHEVLSLLTAQSLHFELIPDLMFPAGETAAGRETSGVAQTIRTTTESLFGCPLNSDQWLLTRLAIDSVTESMRNAESSKYADELSVLLGVRMGTIDRFSLWEEHASELARLAHAVGHPEVAVDLLAGVALDRGANAANLEALVRAKATSLELIDLIDLDRAQHINLEHDYSFRRVDKAEIQLHSNMRAEGRAALAFNPVDLTGLNAFAGHIALPSAQTRPVRLRVDIMSADSTGDPTANASTEMTLKPGEARRLEMTVPRDLRKLVTVIIGVEMHDPRDDIKDAYVRIRDPKFFSRPEGP